MNKKLLKLKHQLDLAIKRNNIKKILELQKKILNLKSDESELEEMNSRM